ncbi:solute carrier family 22 member 7-like [Lissotriton helveticus]
MNFDDLLQDAGGFGRFQVLILLLVALGRTSLPLHLLLNNFLAVVPSHRCVLQNQGEFGNLTEEELLLISIPREPDGALSSCKMYREPQWHLLENSSWGPPNNYTWGTPSNYTWGIPNNSTWGTPSNYTWGSPNKSTWGTPNNSTWGPPNATSLQSCQRGWEYDHSQFTSTIATQWDLVCEQKWLNKASSTFFFIGVTVGGILNGYLSDRYGRRTILFVNYVQTVVFSMIAAASVNYPMFAVFRSLSGIPFSGIAIITFSIALEWVDLKHRTLAWFLASLCWSTGTMILSLVAYLIRDWRWLLVAVTSPYILGIISIWWLPESARWLLAKGKVKKAQAALDRCASTNGQAQLSSSINTERSPHEISKWRTVALPTVQTSPEDTDKKQVRR